MKKILTLAVIFLLSLSSGRASNRINPSIDDYKCSQFLADVKQQTDGERFTKSLMMIAWATGYAAAYDKTKNHANELSFELIAATLGKECRNTPAKLVVQVIQGAIAHILK